jgi:hypothetical protein
MSSKGLTKNKKDDLLTNRVAIKTPKLDVVFTGVS